MQQPLVPVSHGELIDKITILEIKARRIEDPSRRANVERELGALERIWAPYENRAGATLRTARARLKAVNEALWDIEDRIRLKEAEQAFDDEFVSLARSVYRTNDRRAAVKREINELLGSALIEEKSYQPY